MVGGFVVNEVAHEDVPRRRALHGDEALEVAQESNHLRQGEKDTTLMRVVPARMRTRDQCANLTLCFGVEK